MPITTTTAHGLGARNTVRFVIEGAGWFSDKVVVAVLAGISTADVLAQRDT